MVSDVNFIFQVETIFAFLCECCDFHGAPNLGLEMPCDGNFVELWCIVLRLGSAELGVTLQTGIVNAKMRITCL